MPDFTQFSLAVNAGVFAVAAAAVWIAGTHIALYADAISEATGIGHALLGLLLLAGVTSLPEAAVSLTSASVGNAPLAVNNLLGGIAMQIAFLAVADFIIGRRALTSVVPDPVVMMQGALNVALLSIVAAAVLIGDVSLLGVGLWAWFILAGVLVSLRQMVRSHGRVPWLINPEVHGENGSPRPRSARIAKKAKHARSRDKRSGLHMLIFKSAAAGAVILVAGYLISRAGEAIGEQTGLGASFAGAVVLAFATSLPEISTVLGALRLGLYTMAISDIFGTTAFNVGLIFAVDAAAGGEPVLNRVGAFSGFAALLCIVMTASFTAGLAERRDQTLWRMGVDSIAVLVLYAGGLVLLYNLR
jgi:cation:H+ antiporter